jgi:hypothetical protein
MEHSKLKQLILNHPYRYWKICTKHIKRLNTHLFVVKDQPQRNGQPQSISKLSQTVVYRSFRGMNTIVTAYQYPKIHI